MEVRKAVIYFLAACGVLLSIVSLTKQLTAEQAAVSGRTGAQILVLDAGHGGEDGGAVSVSGVAESGINLAIVLKIDALAGLYGVPVVLTRTEDVSLADDAAATLKERKRSDLYNRVALANETPNACLLSIHQNNYTSSEVSGAQVFYRNTEEGKTWAVLTQSALREAIDPENDRVATQIPDSVYLLNHVTCPAILVECGFLSNPEEDQLLQSNAYQSSLAATVFSAYLQYFIGEVSI
ncbi:MAG: N-acetylmuramoyl-L-alanine amidase [Clostridiales bacterium]|nr:N-acetylmuramoyl-L-alanine amidase [Clostridiales bacterium]